MMQSDWFVETWPAIRPCQHQSRMSAALYLAAEQVSQVERENRRMRALEQRSRKRIRSLQERCSRLQMQNKRMRRLYANDVQRSDGSMANGSYIRSQPANSSFLPSSVGPPLLQHDLTENHIRPLPSEDTVTRADTAFLMPNLDDPLSHAPEIIGPTPRYNEREFFSETESRSVYSPGLVQEDASEALTQFGHGNEMFAYGASPEDACLDHDLIDNDQELWGNEDCLDGFLETQDFEESFTCSSNDNLLTCYSDGGSVHIPTTPFEALNRAAVSSSDDHNHATHQPFSATENITVAWNSSKESQSEHEPQAASQLCEGISQFRTDLSVGFNTSQAKWRLDKYILTLQSMLQRCLSTVQLSNGALESLMAEGVLWVVRESWPSAEGFWKLSASFKGFVQSEIWRNFPSQTSYENLHPSYRPTKIQLSIPHSPIIDWLPWPDLRDQVIMIQDTIDVDAVCRAAIENNVAHRCPPSSDKTAASIKTPSSFRLRDLQLLEKQSGINLSSTQGLTHKPRSAGVVALEKAYGLVYDDFSTQKLDPRFFEMYPFLNCESAVSKFKVQEIPVVVKEDVGYPRDLGGEAVGRLARLMCEKAGVGVL